MTSKRVAGIDWATEAKNRACVILRVNDHPEQIIVDEVLAPLSSSDILRVCKDQSISTVGVDIPFGWPRKFGEFVSCWTPASANDAECPPSLDYRYRTTDRFIHERLGKWPLSVSSERFALGSRLWCELCEKEKLQDRIAVTEHRPTARPTIIEVYPAATLAAFFRGGVKLAIDGYKSEKEIRQPLVEQLVATFGITMPASISLEQIVGSGKGSDVTDALIASLTAAIYEQDPAMSDLRSDGKPLGGWRIVSPSKLQEADANKEGWIFFPA